MASSADEPLPPLPPIKTAPSPPSDAASASPSPSSSTQESAAAVDKTEASAAAAEDKTGAAAAAAEGKEPSAPTSKECRILLPEECPAAPHKPPVPRLPAVKRKSRPTLATARVCLAVPRDLTTVFRSMPMPVPAEKRIRAS